MNRNLAPIGLILIFVAVLLFVVKPKPHSVVAAQGGSGGQLGVGDVSGAIAPEFELKLVDGHGKTMKLSDLRGKAVLVNFWATWCGPCKEEMPWLVELQQRYGSQGLQVVGVAMDDDSGAEKTISDFSRKMKVNYPILQGTEKVADLYGGIDGLPSSFFVDRSGKVVDHVLGLHSEEELADNIKKSLAQSETAKGGI